MAASYRKEGNILKKSDYKILILIVESLSNDKGKPVEK
jgi:hypothetical protein